MEFVSRNLVEEDYIVVDSNTSAARNLINYDRRYQYVTDGFNSDLTITTIRINFIQTTTVDRIALLEHNLKGYRLYYNGVTANAFALTTTAATTTAIFSSNSETSQYFFVTPVNVTSVSLQMNTTQVANVEKALGVFFIGESELDFTRIPPSNGYTPKIEATQVIHKMSNGGKRVHKVGDKYSIDIKLNYIPEDFRDDLRDIYERQDSLVFVPFGTSTGWDGILADCVWENGFDFYKFSSEAVGTGFKGSIALGERS